MKISKLQKLSDGTTIFFLNPVDLGKWMYQNKAHYMGNFVEGVLQDSFMLSTSRGYAAVYDHFLNPWVSDLRIEFQPEKAFDVWERWEKFESSSNKTA